MKFLRVVSYLAAATFLLLIEPGCGDQYRPVATPITSPGGQPQKTHFAWVVNFNPGGGLGTTTEIDVSGDTNLKVNNMGTGSIFEAFPGGNLSLYVANRDNDTVSQYLPTLGGAITTISLLPGSRPIYLNSSQSGFMYVLNSGANSTCPDGGSVSTIPATTLAVSNTTCVGPNPIAMAEASTDSFLYVLNGDRSVSVIDTAGPTLKDPLTLPTGQSPVAVTASVDGKYIFIVTQGDNMSAGALNIVSAGQSTVAATVPLGLQPTFPLVDLTLNRLYVVNSGDNTVSVFDASNINVSGMTPIPLLATATVGTTPVAVTALADGSRFYVANAGSNDVSVVSANSFAVVATVPLPSGANPVWITSDPTSSKVYVADKGTSTTTIIQTSNNAITQNLPAPPQVAGCTGSTCALQQPVMILSE